MCRGKGEKIGVGWGQEILDECTENWVGKKKCDAKKIWRQSVRKYRLYIL